MKCFIGIKRKLEDNTMIYREPVQVDKDLVRGRPICYRELK